MMIITYNPHRDTEEPGPGPQNPNPGRRSSWVNVVQKVWMCVSVCEDPSYTWGHSVEGQRASRAGPHTLLLWWSQRGGGGGGVVLPLYQAV